MNRGKEDGKKGKDKGPARWREMLRLQFSDGPEFPIHNWSAATSLEPHRADSEN